MMTATSTSTNTEPLIEIRGVSKGYGSKDAEVVALTGVDLQVARGEFVTIVGPSGCGKTTLLKLMGGLGGAYAGDLMLEGMPVTRPRRAIGFMFQAPTLLVWRTVLANVLLPIEVARLDKKKYVDRAHQLLELAGLKGFESRYPFELSGGMQQRVALVRSLIADPAILLMDEPFGALDAMSRESMNVELMRIWQETGKTVVFVTHSIPEAVFLGDRVVVMSPRPGRITDVVDVALPRPRTVESMNDPTFTAIAANIRRELNATGAID
jgi:NitT/TauT family transport system ATP-binding protein